MHACALCKFKQKSYFYVHYYVFMIHFGNHTLFFLFAFSFPFLHYQRHFHVSLEYIVVAYVSIFSFFPQLFFLLLFLLLTSRSFCVLQQQKSLLSVYLCEFSQVFPFLFLMWDAYFCLILFFLCSVLLNKLVWEEQGLVLMWYKIFQ